MSPSIDLEALERLIRSRLKSFYDRREQKLAQLKLSDLISKNLYLFRACGISKASELIDELMKSRLVKSDETIFGKAFFEEIAKAVASGSSAEDVGMDIAIETETTYTVIEVKSGSNWQNARMGRGIKQDFSKAYDRFVASGLQKQFVAVLGQSSGRFNSEPDVEGDRIYLIRSGQAFWQELTGDPDFYLKLIRLMKDCPLQFRPDYLKAWAATQNRLCREFSIRYLQPNGEIDWEQLIRANSGATNSRERLRGSIELE